MTYLLLRNDELVTVHNKFSKIAPSNSTQFATRVWRSRAVRLSWSSRFLIWAAASKMREINLSRVSVFLLWTLFFIRSINKNVTGFWLEIQTALSRQPFKISHVLICTFLTTADTTTWITLYIDISLNVCSSSFCCRLRLNTYWIKTANIIYRQSVACVINHINLVFTAHCLNLQIVTLWLTHIQTQ